MGDVKSMESIIESNEDFFLNEYDLMDNEFKDMFDEMNSEEN